MLYPHVPLKHLSINVANSNHCCCPPFVSLPLPYAWEGWEWSDAMLYPHVPPQAFEHFVTSVLNLFCVNWHFTYLALLFHITWKAERHCAWYNITFRHFFLFLSSHGSRIYHWYLIEVMTHVCGPNKHLSCGLFLLCLFLFQTQPYVHVPRFILRWHLALNKPLF